MATTKNTTIETQPFSKVEAKTGSSGHQVKGYAVLYNQPSQPMPYIEYFDKGAFDGVDLSDVLLDYAHDMNNILARTGTGSLTITQDDKGLVFTADLADTTLANDVVNDINAGNVRGVSPRVKIAPDGDRYYQDNDGNTIHEIMKVDSLIEIAITPIPAYPETSVTVTRDYINYLKGESNMAENKEEKKTSEVASSASAQPKSASVASTAVSIDYSKLAKAIVDAQKAQSSVSSSVTSKTIKRDDIDDDDSDADNVTDATDGVDDSEDDDVERDVDPASVASSASANSSASSSATSSNSSASSSSTASSTASSSISSQSETKTASNVANKIKKEGKTIMRDLNNGQNSLKDYFKDYLTTGTITRDLIPDTTNGGKLSNGQVLIPHDILTPKEEGYQFKRLSQLIGNESVHHTTGLAPVFKFDDRDALSEHTEFTETPATSLPEPLKINWNLTTYTGRVLLSQDLLSDSDYDWEGKMNHSLLTWKDNKNDHLAVNALTAGITADKFNTDDPIAQLKNVLDGFFDPQDSANASIVLSKSAFAALDTLEDKMGRPLVQPDVTKTTSNMILGKSVVVVPDNLFPNAKAGDINIVVSPLNDSVINFHNRDITGKLQDTTDVWYTQLGVYMREDVVQARPDLIKWISSTTGATKAAADLKVTKPTN